MAQSLSHIVVHLVFSTKERQQLLRDDERARLHSYVGGVLAHLDCQPLEINSVRDHIHLLFVQSKNHAPAKVIEQLKTSSAIWLKALDRHYHDFGWQNGYGEFSVSPSHVDAVRDYIRRQPEHHAAEDFQTEYRRFCEKNGMPVDERYVWTN